MTLFRRFLYYFGGFALGLFLLFFFLGGKRASCDYGPNARTLKNIRQKPRSFTPAVEALMLNKGIDTSTISQILIDGDVLFKESITDLDSCNVYVIQGSQRPQLKISVQNCDSQATVQDILILNPVY